MGHIWSKCSLIGQIGQDCFKYKKNKKTSFHLVKKISRSFLMSGIKFLQLPSIWIWQRVVPGLVLLVLISKRFQQDDHMTVHWQMKHCLLGLRPGHPGDNGSQEGDYSAWVAWEKGKMKTKRQAREPEFPFPSGYPGRVAPLLWPIIYRAPWPKAHLILQ